MSKKINVEAVKLESEGLRGSLAEDLQAETPTFTEENKHLLKFHGVYAQHDRDVRRGQEDSVEHYHTMMIRTKVPGGQLTPAQYLAHDDLASEYANDTLRITTRECFQFHGVIKGDLHATIHELNQALITTFGACGDVVRNVMACPAPTADPQRQAVQEFAFTLTEALFPRTSAYHQIWVDGEAVTEDKPDPLYGKTYLPRKFKIAVAYAGDNCVDIFTNDLGLVALFDESNQLTGFNLLVGGGMGMTHNNPETFPRLADVVAFVLPEQVIEAVQAVVTIHRDYGDRNNRKHARLKYILHDMGLDAFQALLQSRVNFTLEAPRPMPAFQMEDHLGWHEQGDGKLYLGLPVESGRIVDREGMLLKSALRHLVADYQLPVRLTAQQNILLTDINPADRSEIENVLEDYGVQLVEAFSPIRRYALACPAMPTCSLAITEAERILPQLISDFEALLAELGLGQDEISLRVTGCPNGCARPYMAEIGLVGRALNKYAIFLGGSFEGTRLAEPAFDLIHLDDITNTLRPILSRYQAERFSAERFGDFVARVGVGLAEGAL